MEEYHPLKHKLLSVSDIDRIIEMAWEDKTPFKAIDVQFGLTEGDVIRLMRRQLKPSSFKMWRKRVNQGISSKHSKKTTASGYTFRSSQQRNITGNKISKR